MPLFRILVRNRYAPNSLLHNLQTYAEIHNLAGIKVLQGYDLALAGENSASSLGQFCALHLADPVCDRYLIREFPDPQKFPSSQEPPSHSGAWQELLQQLGRGQDGNSRETSDSSPHASYLAYETLAAQFDPRAAAVQDCWRLWTSHLPKAPQLDSVRCFWLYCLYPQVGRTSPGSLLNEDLAAIHRYLWNPLELQVKDPKQFSYHLRPAVDDSAGRHLTESPSRDLGEFPEPELVPLLPLTPEELRNWAEQAGLRFDAETLRYIHAYYQGQKLPGVEAMDLPREPTLAELRILEAYWSDHCRHTTFHTELEWPTRGPTEGDTIEPPELRQAWQLYQQLRRDCGSQRKTQCLMDIATLGAQSLCGSEYMQAVEISAEVNACSVFVDVEDDQGQSHKRLLMFKNETHNHPTEIEPYGGAATCLGGAIRDPLSGRSYVYQALRLSGAASPNQESKQVRLGKLPQRKICREAARGFADYGNRIGLSCNLVWEFYHPGFEAKRFECGMVVGVAPVEQVRRREPQPGDLVLLLGGATGRDGIGGASGSSATHDSKTVETNGSEVQRGNPIEERKLQRLFRRGDVGYLIKRCNDFGAGGIAVAVGEIAAGTEIDLSAIPTKYQGLRASELAVSESQERMAVVVAAEHGREFCQKAKSEGVSAALLGKVTQESRFRLHYGSPGSLKRTEIANLARDFLDSSGFSRRASIHFGDLCDYSPKALLRNLHSPLSGDCTDSGNPEKMLDSFWLAENFEAALCATLRLPQVASQRGLQGIFDSSIGSTTLFQPYPRFVSTASKGELPTYGRSEVSAQLIPLGFPSEFCGGVSSQPQEAGASHREYRESRRASLISFAYDAQLSSSNSFLGAQVAVLQSAAKVLAAGAERSKAYLSLQEYFPRLETPELWGKAAAALLGALQAQHRLGLAAIGGKDSMSGSFEELQVPPVLSSFACATAPSTQLRPSNWQESSRYLYLLGQPRDFVPLHKPDYPLVEEYWQTLQELGHERKNLGARLIGPEGLLGAVALFSFGGAPKRFHFSELPWLRWEALDSSTAGWLFLPYASDPSFSAMLLSSAEPMPIKPHLQLLGRLESCLPGSEALLLPDSSGGKEVALDAKSPAYQAWCRFEANSYYPVEMPCPSQLASASVASPAPSPMQCDLLASAQKTLPENENRKKSSKRGRREKQRVRVVVPIFPGSNGEDDMLRSFFMAGSKFPQLVLELRSPVLNLLNAKTLERSLENFAGELQGCAILALPGGFSASDEPDGSAKFIASVLRQHRIAEAIDQLLGHNGLILGICNGFQALIKTGLLPYGQDWEQGDSYGRSGLSISHNRQGHHIADLELCRVCPTPSPWLSGMSGKDYLLPISHGEGCLIMPETLLQELRGKQQLAAVYHRNVNGSIAGIEALCSEDGRILGKMAHSERRGAALYGNIPYSSEGPGGSQVMLQQNLFANGLRYFL